MRLAPTVRYNLQLRTQINITVTSNTRLTSFGWSIITVLQDFERRPNMAAATRPAQRYYTLAEGKPLPRNDTSDQLRTGSGGGFVLLTSTQLIENLAHFSRERIPERAVHAKAAGAWGYYEVTDDISDLTDAEFLNGIGNKTEVLTRISTVGPERGSADTVRDFRGFAIKFKTTQGNNDWVFNNQVSIFWPAADGHWDTALISLSSLSSSFAIPSNSRP
jgi:hypothetical protein